MVGLTSQEELLAKDKEIDQSTKLLDNDDSCSEESNADTIVLTIFATIVMGILIFLFK